VVREIRNDKGFWAGYAVLLLVGIFLGLRSERTVTTVLAANSRDIRSTSPSTGPVIIDPVRLVLQDSLLVHTEPKVRDPFHPLPVKPKPRREEPKPELPEIPSLRALMYDSVNPSAQINIGSSRSGWLYEGDTFRGWKVINITQQSVWISKAHRTYVIRQE
jgi:hypothetical protein